MTPQERDIIGQFIARFGDAPKPGGFPVASVPATQQTLPPIDPEADRFIGEQFSQYPEARYRITQLAFVQEAALSEAQSRIKRLEADLAQAQARPAPSRGLFGGLFGSGQAPPPPNYAPRYAPPPQPAYSPGYAQPGMFQSGGSGFLGSALTTAAGVAGGVLAAEAITSMFSPHGFGGGFGGGGQWGGGVTETTINNYGTSDSGQAGGDPWAGAGTSDNSGGDTGTGGWSDAPASDPGTQNGGDGWSGGGDTGADSGGWEDTGGGGGDGSF